MPVSSTRRARPFTLAILIVGAGALAPRAARGQASVVSDSAKQVAVVIFAEASAREVRFAKQPQLHVKITGGLDSVHVLERRNLPSPVVAGTTYRDVYVAVEIFGRLNAECIANTLTGQRDKTASPDCASLELRGTTRPPSDSSSKPPRS